MEKILAALAELRAELKSVFSTAKATVEEKTVAEAKLKEFEGLIAARDASIKDLNAQLEKAQGEVNAKGTEVTNLQAQLEAEKKRVDETLAGMGVDPKNIPAKKDEAAAPSSKSIVAEWDAIQDPKAKMEFYRKNAAAIDAAWSK